MSATKPKLLVLQTHPIQYYSPLFRALAQRGAIDISVIYLTDGGAKAHFDPGFNREIAWDVDLLSGYPHWIAKPGLELSQLTFWSRYDPSILTRIEQEQPDWVLLYGYSSRMNWKVLKFATKRGIQVLYTSDTNIRTQASPGAIKGLVKSLAVGNFFKGISRFLAPGNNNREYLLKYGAPKDRITWSPFAIEAERFRQSEQRPGRVYDFLWAGKLIDRKRCQDYALALEELRRRGIPFRALLIGDGPLEQTVSQASAFLRESGQLHKRGFANQSEMPALLQAAQALVFTSENEPYGLIATEAAAAGCALIVADGIGCLDSKGSAQVGRNAIAYPCGDVGKLADAMQQVLGDTKLRDSMQAESRKIGEEHDIPKAAEIIESVVLGKPLASW